MIEKIYGVAKGRCRIVDDLGNVLLDKTNAIHPQNLARVFARSLAHEHNYFIYRMAFGNGGTIVDAAFTVTYKTPNDGQPPDTNTWDSRIYNETYSEIVDAGQDVPRPQTNPDGLGSDPGSADLNTGVRPGGGSVPTADPLAVMHVSGPGCRSVENGLSSQVIISCVMNAEEPLSQFGSDSLPPTQNTETSFVFDEIGLYTSGAPAISTSGYMYIDVGDRNSLDDSGLLLGASYSFQIKIDGGSFVTIAFTTPVSGGSGSGGEILYGDLCEAINTGSIAWGLTGVNPLPGGATIAITDNSGGEFPTIAAAETFGFLRFESPTSGTASSVALNTDAPTLAWLAALNPPTGGLPQTPVQGVSAGVQNAPVSPLTERERLLAHLIFSPVLKSANRTLAITYTLTISFARTP